MVFWEYIGINASSMVDLMTQMNREGKSGWEAVSCMPSNAGIFVLLKRPYPRPSQ